MTDEPLFPEDGLRVELPVPPDLSPDRRRTLRQAEQIKAGVHPLLAAVGAPDTRLHPRASPAASRSDRRGLPFTCGSCLHLVHQGGGPGSSGRYLKCDFGEGERVTHGAGTDVRAWWPACLDYLGEGSASER